MLKFFLSFFFLNFLFFFFSRLIFPPLWAICLTMNLVSFFFFFFFFFKSFFFWLLVFGFVEPFFSWVLCYSHLNCFFLEFFFPYFEPFYIELVFSFYFSFIKYLYKISYVIRAWGQIYTNSIFYLYTFSPSNQTQMGEIKISSIPPLFHFFSIFYHLTFPSSQWNKLLGGVWISVAFVRLHFLRFHLLLFSCCSTHFRGQRLLFMNSSRNFWLF